MSNDVSNLHNALKRASTDKQAVIDVLTHRTYKQRDEIANAFTKNYNYDFHKLLSSKFTGVSKVIVNNLMTLPTHFLADQLLWAVKGAGTDEQTLIDILVSMNAKEKSTVKTIFMQKSGYCLCYYVRVDLAGYHEAGFRGILTALMDTKRPDDKCVDVKQAKSDASSLYSYLVTINNWTSRAKFHRILVSRSWIQLKKTFEIFEEKYGSNFEQRIIQLFTDRYQDTLKAIYQYAMDSNTFFAEALYRDLNHVYSSSWRYTYGVARVFTWRSEIDLGDIAAAFQDKYKISLVNYVKKETRGSVENALVGILN